MPSTSAHLQYPAPIPHIQHQYPYPIPRASTNIPYPVPGPVQDQCPIPSPVPPSTFPAPQSLAMEEGFLQSMMQEKGLGVARAPSGLGLGCSILLDVALSAKSHEACGSPRPPLPPGRTLGPAVPAESSSRSDPPCRHLYCCLWSFMNIVAKPFLPSLLPSREPQTFCAFVSTSLSLSII